jgi:hypothetical protein
MRLRLAFALGIGSLVACGDSTDPLPVDGTMHATIVGSSDPWDAENTLTARVTNGNLFISGAENSSVAITLTIHDAAVGVFSAAAGAPAPAVEATYGDNRTFSYGSVRTGGSATVTLTEFTATRAVGTFEFVATPVVPDFDNTASYRVANGTFNVAIR